MKQARTAFLVFSLISACGVKESAAGAYKKSMFQPSELDQRAKRTLRFTEAIYSADFGLPPNPNIDGKSLFEVVTSREAGRDDGQVCAACHNDSLALGDYWVPTGGDEVLDEVDPTALVAGKPWAGAGGWAERFVANQTKPKNVQMFIQAWINSGYQ